MSEESSLPKIDEKEWFEAWSGRILRTLVRPLAIDIKEYFSDLSNVKVLGVSSEPKKYENWMFRVTGNTCPFCGSLTCPSNRIAVKFNLEFGNKLPLGASVWSHQECFEECQKTELVAGIPW